MLNRECTFRPLRIVTPSSGRLPTPDRFYAHATRASKSNREPLPTLPAYVDARYRAKLSSLDADLRFADEILRVRDHDLNFLLSLREGSAQVRGDAAKYRYKNLFYRLAVTAEDMPQLGPLFRLVSIASGIHRKRRLVNRLWNGARLWLKQFATAKPADSEAKHRLNMRLQRHMVADLGDMGRVGIADYGHLANQVDALIMGLNSLHILAGLKAIQSFRPENDKQSYDDLLRNIQTMMDSLTKRLRAANRFDEINPAKGVDNLIALEELHAAQTAKKPTSREETKAQITAYISAFHDFLDVLDFPFPKT